MTDIIVPNTFQNKTETAKLSDLDDNFTTLANAISAGTGGVTLDGGTPSTVFTGGAILDCGGVT